LPSKQTGGGGEGEGEEMEEKKEEGENMNEEEKKERALTCMSPPNQYSRTKAAAAGGPPESCLVLHESCLVLHKGCSDPGAAVTECLVALRLLFLYHHSMLANPSKAVVVPKATLI
jgi:hypothetical protein